MREFPGFRIHSWVCAAALLCGTRPAAIAEPIPVRHVEGTEHGFLAVRTKEGRIVAVGDLYQVVHGDTVNARLTFRFKDGSVDDETTVFSQRDKFHLITDHHIQRGPSFPQPLDISIDARHGQVTVRSRKKDGKDEVKTRHLDLPPDLVNGLVLSVSKNILPETPETEVSMLVATPELRLIKLRLSPRGEEPFSLAGSPRKATRYEIKIELGGVAGLIAPLIGKQPANIQIWIIGGEAPAFVREEGPLYQGGPIWTIQLTSPVWPDLPNQGL
jgi:hypothetical protein